MTVDSGSFIKRASDQAQGRLVKSMDRLSSGLRITQASDDPAGMAIASELESGASVARKGIDNASYADSALRIADSAVGQVQSITDRLGELAQQSANGTLSDNQRVSLQDEYSQLTQEIDRIAGTTQFNGVNLLQGQGFKVPVGDASNPNNMLELKGISVSSAPLAGYDISSQDGARNSLNAINNMRSNLNDATASIGALEKRLDTASNTQKVAAENMDAARSRIQDVDYASEVAKKTADEIVQKSGVALQAHSLQSQSMILKLLG